MSVRKWIDHILFGAKLLRSNRSLKYFPPDFTVRRPLHTLLDRHSRRGDEIYLALFRLECPDSLLEVWPDLLPALREDIRRQLRLLASGQWEDDELIGMDQIAPQEFIVLVKGDPSDGEEWLPDALRRKFDQLRRGLELELSAGEANYRRLLRLTGTYVPMRSVPISNGGASADRLEEACRFALALATRQLTPQTLAARRQLDRILRECDISVLAQPIMDLRSGDIFGWEILTRGPAASVFHLPEELFRFASQSNQLCKLEFLIVKTALEEIAARQVREPVFLNVTAVTLGHPQFLDHVLECLKEHPSLRPAQIVFEITERHEVKDFVEMAEVLGRFRRHGFRFAVDDMGAGYSSLQWIGELSPELIKIDRSVIQYVDRIAVKMSLLRAIVTAAREMSCEVVAEGVEREEEADVLFRLNVGMGQGYYFARPNALPRETDREIYKMMKELIQHRRQAAS
ncbi:EAL domain-containing protein [Cohnella zeiphila]|uniref:EAL domain-containing protein n=1 Tax=Cohnella zeiphila TaxID=2761120 RepID=A0A7X0SLQ3_9BACL|nr:EAL domain-containing protein [Cohnella zeiphila]